MILVEAVLLLRVFSSSDRIIKYLENPKINNLAVHLDLRKPLIGSPVPSDPLNSASVAFPYSRIPHVFFLGYAPKIRPLIAVPNPIYVVNNFFRPNP